MRILILEDNKERCKIFRKELVGHEYFITEFASEAIEKLTESEWDYLFLDHDLGGEVFVTKTENTGYQVALWLEEHKERHPKTIYLHSMNSNGRARMKQALPDSIEAIFGMQPVSSLIENNEE